MSRKMTQEEIAGQIKSILDNHAANLIGGTDVKIRLADLCSRLTAPEIEEPQEGPYEQDKLGGQAFLAGPRGSCGWGTRLILCDFTQYATPATRRLIKEAYSFYKWAIKNLPRLEDEVHNGGAQFFCGNDTDELQTIVKFIQTGETGEGVE